MTTVSFAISYNKIDPELKAKWVDALRSGEYEQGREYFIKDNKYCCLGVLCDVAGVPLQNSELLGMLYDNYAFVEEALKSHGTTVIRDLYTMNDCERLSFPEIADWIEENL